MAGRKTSGKYQFTRTIFELIRIHIFSLGYEILPSCQVAY